MNTYIIHIRTYITVLLITFSNLLFAAPFAYVTNFAGNDVSVIDISNKSGGDTVIAKVSVGNGPHSIVLNPVTARAYVTNSYDNDVSVIDTANNSEITTVPVGREPRGLAVDPLGARVYVANSGNDTVSVIDTANNTVIDTVEVKSPYAIAIHPYGTKVYVTNSFFNTVSVIDTSTHTVTDIVNVGKNPQGIALNPAGTKVYVTNRDSHTVSVIDTATNTLTDTVDVGTAPFGIAINLEGAKAYVTNRDSVSVIDTTNNKVVATALNGKQLQLQGIAINSAGTQAYVATANKNQVAVVDLITNSYKTGIEVGTSPLGMAITPINPDLANRSGASRKSSRMTDTVSGASNTQSLISTSDSISCVFNYFESKYPQYYAPANKTLLTYKNNSYRYYATTDSLLVYSPTDDRLYGGYGYYGYGYYYGYYYLDAGSLTYWKDTIGCDVQKSIPTVSLTAAPMTVDHNGSTTLQWTAVNATSCSSNFSGNTATSGSEFMSGLTGTQTYSLTCTGKGGSTSKDVTVTVKEKPSLPSISLTAAPMTVEYNGSTTLQWTAVNATSCSSNFSGSDGTSGSEFMSGLTGTQSYSLTCTGKGGSTSKAVTVTVKEKPSVPIVSLTAAPMTVEYNGSTTLQWTATNATSCSSNFSGSDATSGSEFMSGLTGSQSYNLTCTGKGGSNSKTITVTVKEKPSVPTVSLTAAPMTVEYNGSTTLQWTAANATSCSSNFSGNTGTSGSEFMSGLTGTQSYNLTCTGKGGSTSKIVTVTVKEKPSVPTVSLTAAPMTVEYNGATTLQWTAANATSCSSNFSGSDATSGSQYLSGLTGGQTFNLTCTGKGGSTSKVVTVTVKEKPSVPTVSLTASPMTVEYNGSTTLQWTATNATSCSSNFSGNTDTSGSEFVSGLTSSQTYSLTCNGKGGSTSKIVTVTVKEKPSVPTVSLTASPMTVEFNGSTILQWSATNAIWCSSNFSEKSGTSGSEFMSNLTSTQTYTLTCTGKGGSTSKDVTVTVNPQKVLTPTISIVGAWTRGPGDDCSLYFTTDTGVTVSGDCSNTAGYHHYVNGTYDTLNPSKINMTIRRVDPNGCSTTTTGTLTVVSQNDLTWYQQGWNGCNVKTGSGTLYFTRGVPTATDRISIVGAWTRGPGDDCSLYFTTDTGVTVSGDCSNTAGYHHYVNGTYDTSNPSRINMTIRRVDPNGCSTTTKGTLTVVSQNDLIWYEQGWNGCNVKTSPYTAYFTR